MIVTIFLIINFVLISMAFSLLVKELLKLGPNSSIPQDKLSSKAGGRSLMFALLAFLSLVVISVATLPTV